MLMLFAADAHTLTASPVPLIVVALIGFAGVTLAASIPALIVGRQRDKRERKEREARDAKELEDRRRQDEVARLVAAAATQAQDAAALLAQQQEAQRVAAEEVAAEVRAAAAQAAEAAVLLKRAQEEAATERAEVAATAAEVAANVDHKMTELGQLTEKVHKLVNSDMTAARLDQKNEAVGRLKTLERIVAIDEAAGRTPAVADLEEIEATRAKIEELTAILADRLIQQRAVEAQSQAENRLRGRPDGIPEA
jgi:D-alanyl-D-alanine carboxypeptidase/D-alanyl-D-alanine-endopeptidase (penicillin-binding protein 4)